MWKLCESNIEEVKKISGKDRVCVLHVGDLTQGMKYVSALVSTRVSDQIAITLENLRPWCEMKNVSHIRLAGGTSSHEFGESTSSIIIKNTLKGEYMDKNIEMCEHGLLNVSGVDFNYAHHGPFPGSRLRLKGNVVRYYLRDLMMTEVVHGNKPPDLVLRAHYHTPVQEYLSINGYSSWLYILPSYSILGIYTRQATRCVNSVTNGLNVYEIIGGKIEKMHLLHSRKDIRTNERIQWMT